VKSDGLGLGVGSAATDEGAAVTASMIIQMAPTIAIVRARSRNGMSHFMRMVDRRSPTF
jgi:hypothetical protein